MNYYDILFSKFLNKGGGGDTPSGGDSYIVDFVVSVTDDSAYELSLQNCIVVTEENAPFQNNIGFVEIQPGETKTVKALKNYPSIQLDEFCVFTGGTAKTGDFEGDTYVYVDTDGMTATIRVG